MAKDYAKRIFTTRAYKKKRRRIEWFALPLVLILLGVGVYWVYFPKIESGGHLLTDLKTWLIHPSPAKPASATIAKAPEPEVHFDFYSQLPSMQVAKKVFHANQAQFPTTPGFVIQLGLFKKELSAAQSRLTLVLQGCEADVVKINTEHGDIYRIQKGPFATKEDADKLLRQLAKKGIVGVIKKA